MAATTSSEVQPVRDKGDAQAGASKPSPFDTHSLLSQYPILDQSWKQKALSEFPTFAQLPDKSFTFSPQGGPPSVVDRSGGARPQDQTQGGSEKRAAAAPSEPTAGGGTTQPCDTSPQLANQKFNNTCGLDLDKLHQQTAPNIGRVQNKDVSTGGTIFKVCNDKDQCAWATANHTIDGAPRGELKLRTADGSLHGFTPAVIDRKNDIAILRDNDKSEESPTAERPGLKLATEPMKAGEPVLGVGHGSLLDHLMLTPGKVSDPDFTAPSNRREVFNFPGQKGTLADAQSVPGQSGGPALDAQGRVRGMISNGEPGSILYARAGDIAADLDKAFQPSPPPRRHRK